jgi:molybdopterin-guanine dinucleotide biosynthesis protein MobB
MMGITKFKKPVLGFSAYSGTGKTTLLVKLLPLLKLSGLRVAMVKHAHHDFDIDKPGKDSYELRKAGAEQMLVASDKRWALMTERRAVADPHLDDLIDNLNLDECDLVLVEGFRHLPFAKIELHRPSLAKPLLYPDDDTIIAIASDQTLQAQRTIDQLDINDIDAIADYIEHFIAHWTY